jgi:hypothetical protein
MPIEPAATLPLTDDTTPLPTVQEPASVGIAAAVALAAAVWVAIEEWQAQDGGQEERGRADRPGARHRPWRTLAGHADPEHTMSDDLDHA